MKKRLVLAIVAGMLLTGAVMAESITVIPGLKGFGTDTRAAYGAANPPEICIVDSLLTTGGNPSWDALNYSIGVFKGTLNQCLMGLDTLNGEIVDSHTVLPNSGKIILFEVSGTINATSAPYTYRNNYPYTTIAGQSAPSPGVTLRNIMLTTRAHDVLIQHIRSRIGDAASGVEHDQSHPFAITSSGDNDVYNVVFDHLSGSWAIDTNGLVWKEGEGQTHDCTWSNSIFSEALHNSLHSKGPHSKGPVINVGTEAISFINNFMVSNDARNPYIRRSANVLVNNYIYNPGYASVQIEIVSGAVISSIVGNLVEGGPSSGDYAYENHFSCKDITTASEIYLHNNKCGKTGEGWYIQASASDWSRVHWWGGQLDVSAQIKVLSPPLWPTGLVAIDVNDVKAHVLANAGARPADRDSADQRVVNHAKSNGTQGQIIDSPSDVGGWPILVEDTRPLTLPDNPHGDDDGDCYTNLEEWLHKLAVEVEGANLNPDINNDGKVDLEDFAVLAGG